MSMLAVPAAALSGVVVFGMTLVTTCPEWLHFKTYVNGTGYIEESTGLWMRCRVGAGGGIRWSECARNWHHDRAWNVICQIMYAVAFALAIAGLVLTIKAAKVGTTTRYWYALSCTFTFFTVAVQVCTLGLYGDHANSQRWCISKAYNPCTIDAAYSAEEAVTYGWTYWIAVVTSLISAGSTLLNYYILNSMIEEGSSNIKI